MKAIRAVIAVLLDLVIGDDWRITAGIALTLVVTALLALQGVPVWWLPRSLSSRCSPQRSFRPGGRP